jgi:uncharacterized protein YcfJ
MRSLAIRCQYKSGVVAILLAGTIVLAGQDSARGQYIYQPPPSYYQNDQVTGTVAGGAFGAVTGAILGGRKDRGEGALIGAGIGAITGNLLGKSKDNADERRVAAGAATVGQLNAHAAAQAVTNYDLLQMTRAGLSEDVIISTMQSRGARLDLSPQSLIALKQSGVGDRVVMAAQQMNGGVPYVAGSPPLAPVAVVREVPTTRVIVTEPWPYYGCRPYYHHHHHHHHRPHSHISIGF